VNIKRLTLIRELLEGSKQPLTTERDILRFCQVTEAKLEDSCRSRLPFAMLRLEYYVLGKRAARARQAGRIPDGSINGRAPRG
jgi:hypothetical protein